MKYKFDDKLKKYFILIAVVSIFLSFVFFIQKQNNTEIENGVIKRPAYTEDSKNVEVEAKVDDQNEVINSDINLEPERLSLEETENMFDEVYDKLQSAILNGNDNLENVHGDLNLMSKLEDYPAEIEWYSDDYSLIDYDGTVHNDDFTEEEKQNAKLLLNLKYYEYRAEYTLDVVVTAPVMTKEERLKHNITTEINKANENNQEEPQIQLPSDVDGKAVTYSYKNDTPSFWLPILLGSFAMAAIAVAMKKEEINKQKAREEQIKYDYSELVSKFTLLVGASMAVRKAWAKIVEDYLKQKKNEEIQERYVYEEMVETYNQMNAGIPETVAYEQFGKRCNTKEYIKFGTLLVQNVKKGTKDLIRMLEQESYEAAKEHENIVKKKGEEAGTKLLIPMIIMLIVVMIIVITPALMSFQI